MVRSLHVIPSLSLKHGGPSYAIRAITRALASVDIDVSIATTDDDGNNARLKVPLGVPVPEDGAIVYYFRRNILPYKISFGLRRWLNQNVAQFDVVHIHALFSFSSTAAAHAARRHGVPYIVRPLGVLNRWGLKNRRSIAKQISLQLIELPMLQHAAAIHYTSEAEKREAMAVSASLGDQRSTVIPLPVQSLKGDPADFLGRYPQVAGRRLILFLSRIDQKKGLDLLLDAFSTVHREIGNVVLVIAGDGTPSYVNHLHDRAQRLGIADLVIWPGYLAGALKAGALAAAEAFVLPSYSENFGVAAAEALAAGVPTIVTDGVAISDDIRRYDAGIVVKSDASEIADAISRILTQGEAASRFAVSGRRLAHDRYSVDSVGHQLRQLYDSVLQSGSSSSHKQ